MQSLPRHALEPSVGFEILGIVRKHETVHKVCETCSVRSLLRLVLHVLELVPPAAQSALLVLNETGNQVLAAIGNERTSRKGEGRPVVLSHSSQLLAVSPGRDSRAGLPRCSVWWLVFPHRPEKACARRETRTELHRCSTSHNARRTRFPGPLLAPCTGWSRQLTWPRFLFRSVLAMAEAARHPMDSSSHAC